MFRLSKSVAILLVAFLVTLIHVSAAPVERPVISAAETSDTEKASFNTLYDMYKPLYDQYYAQLASNSLVARSHENDDHDECDDDDSCNDSDDWHDECHDDDSCDNEHDDCHEDDSCDDGHDSHEESIETGSISATSGTSATVIYPPFPPLPPFPSFPPPPTFPPFPPFPPSS
ncbi:hypothetical protein MAM1_0033d02536 [Mucor ambiguus]|uniref:Uncharacterized protein n=1 Tax=Mucor ambiguus TaxID=91626 RepID=A0A0C9LSR1_9FUNG|nr:hypothetical protein MAM1_0033d02536 [Mucor ambiguus]